MITTTLIIQKFIKLGKILITAIDVEIDSLSRPIEHNKKNYLRPLNSTKMIRLSGFWRPKRFWKKFKQHWKKKFSSNKKVGHSQKEHDQFFFVKGVELSNGLLCAKISRKKESEQ